MDPLNAIIDSLFFAGCTWVVVAGVLYTIGISRRRGLKVTAFVTVIGFVLVLLFRYYLIVWYNTPLGPPLDLK
jgi:hypothetical protein